MLDAHPEVAIPPETGFLTFGDSLRGVGDRDRDIVDRTGVTGLFTSTIEAMPSLQTSGDAPSVFTAVQEQVGLKLESIREPTDVIVIDRAEPPTPD